MGLICAAAILAIDNRFRTPSLELKCLGTSFSGAKQKFQSLGTQHGRRLIKAHEEEYVLKCVPHVQHYCFSSFNQ